MSSHVVGRKMHFSKLLFIALVALYVVFARVSANDGDEIAVDAEGEAAAAGAQAVEGVDAGESQAGADVVRSQMASSRAGSGSLSPSKKGKPSKMKLAIIISMIVLVLAITSAVGYFVVVPKVNTYRAKTLAERMGAGLPGDFKFDLKKRGDDTVEKYWLMGRATPGTEIETQVKANREILAGAKDLVTKYDDGRIYFPTKSKADKEKFAKLFNVTLSATDPKKLEEEFNVLVAETLIAGESVAEATGAGLTLAPLPAEQKEKPKTE